MTGNVPFLIEAQATARREAMLAEAARMRVLNRTAARVPGAVRRYVGAVLVAAGERVHGPSAPPTLQPAC